VCACARRTWGPGEASESRCKLHEAASFDRHSAQQSTISWNSIYPPITTRSDEVIPFVTVNHGAASN